MYYFKSVKQNTDTDTNQVTNSYTFKPLRGKKRDYEINHPQTSKIQDVQNIVDMLVESAYKQRFGGKID